MKAQKKFLVPLTALLVLILTSGVLAAISVDTTTPLENSVFCQSHGNLVDMNFSGSGDGNLFAIYVTSAADGNLWLNQASDSNGNIHSDFNAVYANSLGYFEVVASVPPSGATGAANITTGDLTVTVFDLNNAVTEATFTLNVKPVWTTTEFTITSDNNSSAKICEISNYTSVNKLRFTDSSSNYIEFDETVDVSSTLDFDASMALTNTSAEVATGTLTTLANEPATIVWSNLDSEGLVSTDVEVMYNTGDALAADQECPPNKCLLVTPTPGQIELSVSDFSTYKIQRADGAPSLPTIPGVSPEEIREQIGGFQNFLGQTNVFGVSNWFVVVGLFAILAVVIIVIMVKK